MYGLSAMSQQAITFTNAQSVSVYKSKIHRVYIILFKDIFSRETNRQHCIQWWSNSPRHRLHFSLAIVLNSAMLNSNRKFPG